MAAVADALEAGRPSSGRVELDDLAPSPVEADLEVDAALERVAARRLMLVTASPFPAGVTGPYLKPGAAGVPALDVDEKNKHAVHADLAVNDCSPCCI